MSKQCYDCGELRTYYPDFYLPQGNTVVEIKPISMLDIGNNPIKLECGLKNIENYVILTEIDGFLDEDTWDDFYRNQVYYWINNTGELHASI